MKISHIFYWSFLIFIKTFIIKCMVKNWPIDIRIWCPLSEKHNSEKQNRPQIHILTLFRWFISRSNVFRLFFVRLFFFRLFFVRLFLFAYFLFGYIFFRLFLFVYFFSLIFCSFIFFSLIFRSLIFRSLVFCSLIFFRWFIFPSNGFRWFAPIPRYSARQISFFWVLLCDDL